MADGVGPVSSTGVTPIAAAAPSASLVELAHEPPPSLLLAARLSAVVVGRGGNGALLLRTDYGTLALKTGLALPPGSRVDLKLVPGPPPAVQMLNIEDPNGQTIAIGSAPSAAGKPAAAAPPAQLQLGSEIEATLVAPSAGNADGAPALGSRLLLRITLPSDEGSAASATRFLGTVVAGADNPDKSLVATPLGTLALDKRLALPPGTTLGFERLSLAPASAPTGRPALGTIVDATVLAPGDQAAAFPAGTQLTLRLGAAVAAGLAIGEQATMTGTVLAGNGADTVIETPLGTLALARRLALPPGTALELQQLAATLPDPAADPPIGQRAGWPALDQALSVLDHAAPDIAARLRSDLSPQSGQQLAGTLLFLMSAVANSAWPGNKAAAALDDAGRRDLRLRLAGDAGELRRLADPPKGDWQIYMLPLLDGGQVRPVRLYLRRRGDGAKPSEQGTRFVLDIDMSRLGAVQFDGLVRQQRFDLVLRSHRPITAEMRQAITALFHDSTSAAGLVGDVIFTTASRFAVAPLDELRRHVEVDA